jgi:hypothetical protein
MACGNGLWWIEVDLGFGEAVEKVLVALVGGLIGQDAGARVVSMGQRYR